MDLSSAYLDTMRLETDPAADAVIARIVEEYGPQEARRVFEQLISNIELPVDHLPGEVMNFVDNHSALPDWADPSIIMEGQKVFVEHGPMLMSLLYFKALPTTYTCHRGANVLYMTGRLTRTEHDSRKYSRRIAETAQFVIDVMTPGNLLPGGKGIRTSNKIRLIHASIRRFIPESAWNQAEWGKPINQEDMAGTLMSFSSLMLEGLKQAAVNLSKEEQDSYFYAWRVVGHFIGVREELIPKSHAEGKALMDIVLSRQAGSSEAGKALTGALIQFAEELFPTKIFDQAPTVLVKYYCGKQFAEMLGVEYKAGCVAKFLPVFLHGWFQVIAELDEKMAAFDDIQSKVNLALLKGMVAHFNPDKKVQFHIPDKLRQSWGI